MNKGTPVSKLVTALCIHSPYMSMGKIQIPWKSLYTQYYRTLIHAVYTWIMDRGFLCIIFSAIQLENNAGHSQQCYSQPNCVAGSQIDTPADTPTAKDCCVGTNEGQSYADSGGNCIVQQCVGERSLYFIKYTISTKRSWQFQQCTTTQL